MTQPPCPPPFKLPPRERESHKGTYGRCLLIGGSPGMAGSISLSGQAALRSGAGLVTVATPLECRDLVASFEPCYMTWAWPSPGDTGSWNELLQRSAAMDAVGCGPGLGGSPLIDELVNRLYETLSQPLVMDADGLNALARGRAIPTTAPGPRILTPHPGEFRRLLHADERVSGNQLRAQAVDFARAHSIVLVLKGHRTLVTDGQELYENATGNPGMATGGTGDVLTGVITALLGQGLAPFQAAQLGVYLHGLAGDLAAARWGETSLIARDLLTTLPAAFQQVVENRV